jgi:hypothetical protein
MQLSIMTIVIKIIRHYAEGRIFTVILTVNGLCVLTPRVAFFIVMLSVSLCMVTACLLLCYVIVLCVLTPRVAFFIVMLSAFASSRYFKKRYCKIIRN